MDDVEEFMEDVSEYLQNTDFSSVEEAVKNITAFLEEQKSVYAPAKGDCSA